VSRAILGIVFVAAVATFGDHLWYAIGLRNQAAAGSAHGALLLGSVGLVLGWLSGRVLAGLVTGILAGIGGALAYYALVAAMPGRGMNVTAMVAAWCAVWIVLAICDARILRRSSPRSWGEALARGAAAAILGGAAFYYMFEYFWGERAVSFGDYLAHFAAWFIAWAPGILCITTGGGAGRR
jgi:hypothetical protein